MTKVLRIVLEFDLDEDDFSELKALDGEEFTQECIDTLLECDVENHITEHKIIDTELEICLHNGD